MSENTEAIELLEAETDDLLAWHEEVESRHDDSFEAAKDIVERLGAHYVDGRTEVGFWTPELVDDGVPEEDVYLEVLTATGPVDLGGEAQSVEFERELVPLRRQGEYHWGVVDGMRPGTREQLGSLYQLAYRDGNGWQTIKDPVAYSVPFGAYGPAELYDMERLDEERDDREYFQSFGTDGERVPTTEDDGIPRVDPAVSMVEIHPGTATEDGSLGGLARRYEEIGRKQREDEELTPAERNFVGYDAIQVMPVEPLTENEERHDFWSREDHDFDAETVAATVEHPEIINWGYDIVIHAFSAPNPAILETGRPHELVDFIAACHNLPNPIRIVFDVALGHADNGALDLLNDYYFEGPGMYGQDLDYLNPVVRAVVLELQRRKMDFGADGIRIDGAQDFKYWDAENEEEVHDDELLAEMDEVVQEVAGQEYRPWMIYEDGRPWPRGDWELASTYRELIKQHPHSFQWSPITFAHNKPALLTFWASKWWRVYEVVDFGSNWLTGVANHDTLRRGTQQAVPEGWEEDPINPYLGDTAPEIFDRAYDNPATNMLMHCMLPGVPMDFLNANMRGPWGFVRDTDADWNVKVVSEDANVAKWQIREGQFGDERFFQNLKDLGFESREELDHFVHALGDAVAATDYDLDDMATVLSTLDQPFGEDITAEDLVDFGYAWMEDVHHFANLGHWADEQDDERTAFNLDVRQFRHDRPWLLSDVDDGGDEYFDYKHPANGSIIYYGLRESPDGDEQILYAGNMEGTPVDVSPADLDEWAGEEFDVPTDGWEPTLVPPAVEGDGETYTLDNSQAVLWTREP